MGAHTRYVQRTHCCESPVSWMDLGRYSSEERPAPSGAGPDIICRRSAFLPWTCDGFRSSVHSGVTGPQQNYGPATQLVLIDSRGFRCHRQIVQSIVPYLLAPGETLR